MKNITAGHFTSIGYNHEKRGKVCEDCSGIYKDESMCLCVVADGHGSDNYPRTKSGASYAVEAAIEAVKEFVNTAEASLVLSEDGDLLLTQLEKNILLRWHRLVEEDFMDHPFTEEELSQVSERYRKKYEEHTKDSYAKAYGTTLLLFVVTKAYSFGIQIGDGKCVCVMESDDYMQPIPWDDACQMNVTTSICDDTAIDEFRHIILKEPPVAVFCGTDGIDDSYAGDGELYKFYHSVFQLFPEYGEETARNEIEEYLPILSRKGSGDDVSIAYLVNTLVATTMAANDRSE